MKKYFPAQGQKYTYFQTNRSDSLGSLWATMGTDFQSDLNTMRVAPRLMISTNTAGANNLGLPIAFQYWDNNLWAIAGTRVFKNASTPNTVFAEDASTGVQTNYNSSGDLALFNSRLWATTSTGLYSKVADGGGTGAWTARDTGLGAGADHILNYFPLFNRLYYQTGAASVISSIDSSDVIAVTDYRLTLTSSASASCMVSNSTYIWIGVSQNSNIQGTTAYILQWDGISPVATKQYPLKSRWVQAMTVYQDIPYAIDGNGVLSKFTGYSFEEIGRLPYFPQQPVAGYVQRNGLISTRNSTFQVLVHNLNGDNTSTYQNIPSGIWEWAKDFGFTHKYPITYLANGQTGSDITDYGQNKISAPGALFDVSAISPFTGGRNGTLLAGADYFTDATSITHGIFFDDTNDTLQKKGYYVTAWFFSNEIQDNWVRIWTQFKRFIGATDSIVFKYRLSEADPVIATITWTSTTTFTTTTDITAYGPTATGFNGTSGGEVEILQGTGGASCAHITNIVNNAGTYTVTLDSAIVGVTNGTAKARFQKWIKLFPEITGQVKQWEQLSITQADVRIQIKCCMTFTGDDEFYKFALFSNEDIKINA